MTSPLGSYEAIHVGSPPTTRTTSEQALYRLLRFFVKIGAHSRRCLPSCGSRLPSVRYTHRGLPTAAPTIFSLYPPQTAVENVASFAKSHARLVCSVVNALTTAHSRYQLFASYEGSTSTSEKPKKSFSCTSHKRIYPEKPRYYRGFLLPKKQFSYMLNCSFPFASRFKLSYNKILI